jgi:hypothetical protein
MQWMATIMADVIDAIELDFENYCLSRRDCTTEDHKPKPVIQCTILNQMITQTSILFDNNVTGSDGDTMGRVAQADMSEEAVRARIVRWKFAMIMASTTNLVSV